MPRSFREALSDAKGRSEYVIVVIADIRGFSEFSERHESPDVALYIKEFYLRMLTTYFPDATFVKPTGDGLLMTFKYDESNLVDLLATSKRVLNACMTCIAEFPALCSNNPMINFDVPGAIGFGIARGTACCVYAGQETLDYSGKLLNLTARLMDVARPGGIVLDATYRKEVLPEELRPEFKEQKVYLRSIAEERPREVFYLHKMVEIGDAFLVPLRGEQWRTKVRRFTLTQMDKIGNTFGEELEDAAKSADAIRVTLAYRKKGIKGMWAYNDFKAFKYAVVSGRPMLYLEMDVARSMVRAGGVGPRSKVVLRIQYVPKPLPRG